MCKKKQLKYCPSTIDDCMKKIIKWLGDKHTTVACCCGHGRYPMTIVVKEGFKDGLKREIVHREIFSQKIISRKKKFYKKDKKGYYYIPEVSEAKDE